MLGPNLATCHLATWAENVVKPKPKLCKKNGRKNRQKRGRYGVGIKKCVVNKIESRHEALW